MPLFAAGDRNEVDVRTQRLILLREGDPLAVRRDGNRTDAAQAGRGEYRRLAVRDPVAVELLVRGGVEKRL